MRHHTKDKGDIGLGFVIADLMGRGVQVALPISEHLPFDLIAIAEDGSLARLSVKYRTLTQGRLIVRLRSSWADATGSHARSHDKSTYDATAIYCPCLANCYYVRNDELPGRSIVLRTNRPENRQRTRIRFAVDYRNPARLFRQTSAPHGHPDPAHVVPSPW